MPETIRLKTQVGVDREINVQLDQDFEQLEILSLKVRSEDVYTRMCADYGIVVGRVVANGGYGVPNVRVSVFVPLTEEDAQNEIIATLYPYTSFSDVNEDGYRYNLLPYSQQHSGHIPTGTFPTRNDVLTNPAVIEVYDKYYKFSVKTNGSGDYMIMGVPIGTHTLVMDCDLSDIGPFSQSPQDLIRMGRANAEQLDGVNFKSSSDLYSLPQIVNINQSVDVNPFWGQPEICQVNIARNDFDLRSVGINIQPTSVFMGSLVTGIDDEAIEKNCKPPRDMGNLCNLSVGPGEIISVRQTIFQDTQGRPILEQGTLPQGGKVIDGDGNLSDVVSFNIVSTTPSLISYETCSYSAGGIVNLMSGGNQRWNFQTILNNKPDACILTHKIRITFQYTDFDFNGPAVAINTSLPSGTWNLISTTTATETSSSCGTYDVITKVYESNTMNILSTPYTVLISNCGFNWVFTNPATGNSGCNNGFIGVRGLVRVEMISLTASGNGCCVITPANYKLGGHASVLMTYRKNLPPIPLVSPSSTQCNPGTPAPSDTQTE